MSFVALTVVRHSFLSLEEVNLGVLVPEVTEPGVDFWPRKPPQFGEDDIRTRQIANVRQILNEGSSTTLSTKITDYVSGKFAKESGYKAELSAPTCTLYYLRQPAAHFNNLCADDETKIWLERTYKRFPIFLIVGLLTVTDASVSLGEKRSGETELKASIPLTDATSSGITAPIAGPKPLDIGGQFQHAKHAEATTSFKAHGERVIGVQYRKVSFKRFRANKAHNVNLDGTRWVMLLEDSVTRTSQGDGKANTRSLEAALEPSTEVADMDLDNFNITIDDSGLVFIND